MKDVRVLTYIGRICTAGRQDSGDTQATVHSSVVH